MTISTRLLALCLLAGCTSAAPRPPAQTPRPEPAQASAPSAPAKAPGIAEPAPANLGWSEDPPPDVAAPPADAIRTASGLATKVLKPGRGGEHPSLRDTITVMYAGWHPDGKRLENLASNGPRATFAMSGTIAGWSEALQLMTVGERRRLWIPAELAYRDNPHGPQGALVMDVELLAIEHPPEPPQAPASLSTPPANATRTASGLGFLVTRHGSGTRHPQPNSDVTIHHTIWNASGEMVYCSITSQRAPMSFGVADAVPGLAEGLQLMVEGDKAILWMPEALTVAAEYGEPMGDQVYEVELVRIDR